MEPGLLLQGLFGLDVNTTRSFSAHALGAQGTSRTGGRRETKSSALIFSDGAIVGGGMPGRTTDFHFLYIDDKLGFGKTAAVAEGRHLGGQRPLVLRKSATRRPTPVS